MSIATLVEFSCPYCMETNDIDVDEEHDINQAQIVDCQVCCSPIEITITHGIHDRFNIISNTDND